MLSCLVFVCVIAWIGSPNECVTITSVRLYQFGTSQPVDYLDVTGPYSLPHWLYFDFTLNLNESVRVIDFEKDNELLYKSEWNKALIKDELFLGFTRYQITLDVLPLSHGKLVFLQPSVAMEGTYRMTMKARDISGHETVSQWVLKVDALSRCTEMKFDEAFMDANTCIVGMHFYCERPIYPLRTVTRRRVEWTSPDDPDFELQENLRLDEFQTLTDGRILFDFLALYHIRPDSPTSVEMRFMFSQLDDIPLIDHHHTFSTNASQSCKEM
ncbi:uncharacterized protein LOC131893648 isoform X2 [Tigriopus californicus]|uniref:uncharacterized protein LOC131893648 isoform X2 n=1 Tax=Tigriopus californicus TaxID=6832 RepID=UPI0027DA4432|nr:uncharacterized protein LOC131893648 isoform X2 [Tigriopus californicus]